MKTLNFEPMLAVLGLSGGELVVILITLIIFPLMLATAVGLVIWLVRRSGQNKLLPPPAPLPASTKRLCPQCGKEMAADAPQGLCPACLMKVGLGT